MKGIFKINSIRVYSMWQNVAYSLVAVILMLLLSALFPSYIAPVISSFAAIALYFLAYNEKSRRNNCMMMPGAVFLSLISYTLLSLLLNILDLWVTRINIWYELSFFTDPYIPILLYAPIITATALGFLLTREKNNVCTDCQILNGNWRERGQIGQILHRQSKFELKNLIIVFGLLTLTSWLYFFFGYNDVNFTARDTFVFVWFPLIIIICDVFYFANRYFRIYLDLQQLDLVASPQEIEEMPMQTWVRYYVVCEDSMYLNFNAKDEINKESNIPVIETPFIISNQTNGISEGEAEKVIQSLTGVKDGKLKFFFERTSADNRKNIVVRFFYFLPGEVEMYPQLKNVAGTWVSSNKFKTLHYSNPSIRLSPMLNIDMTRLVTILITSKTYNEKGERRTKLKQYHPSFNFEELKNSKLDFQDNTWLRVSYFNSSTPNFRLKRFWRNITRSNNNIPVDE